MKLLLTSGGIKNGSLESALVELLGKPICESNALIVLTGIYPFLGGGGMAMQAINGRFASSLSGLGWKSLGLLELTALPSVNRDAWVPTVQETDAILVWGGDPLYLSHWMRQSGMADLLPSLNAVYVGVSAGSIATATTFGETYLPAPTHSAVPITTEQVIFESSTGEMEMTFITAHGAGLVDFAVIPHFKNENHQEASLVNAEKWASMLPVPTYAIDDQTGIKVIDGVVEVVSEGEWKLFNL
ncbi:MAG: Type 1 glutamine amidotransferase-like domain-containing protein [Chthonomonadales bacterium]